MLRYIIHVFDWTILGIFCVYFGYIENIVTHPEEAARDIDLTKQLSSIVLAQTDELANAQMKVTIDEYMDAIIHTVMSVYVLC